MKDSIDLKLWNASNDGDEILVSQCLKEGAEIDWKNGDHSSLSALHQAAGRGHTNVARLLLDAGWDIETRTAYGATPLYRALGYGRLETAKFLILRGAQIDTVDNSQCTPLERAYSSGQPYVVKFLLICGRGEKNNKLLREATDEEKWDDVALLILAGVTSEGSNALEKLIQNIDKLKDFDDDYVRVLKSEGDKLKNIQKRKLLQILRIAIRNKHSKIIDNVLNHLNIERVRQSINERSRCQSKFKMSERRRCSLSSLDILDSRKKLITQNWSHSINIGNLSSELLSKNDNNELSAITDIAKFILEDQIHFWEFLEFLQNKGTHTLDKGKKEILWNLSDNEVDLDVKVLLTVDSVNKELFTYLLEIKTNFDVKIHDELESSNLYPVTVVYKNYRPSEQSIETEIVHALMKVGVKINLQNNAHDSVKTLVVNSNQKEFLKLFAQITSNIFSDGNTDGLTIINLYVKHNKIDEVKHLLEKGADPNIQDIDGNSLLHIHSNSGNYDILKLLIKYGANPDLKNFEGNSPLHTVSTGSSS